MKVKNIRVGLDIDTEEGIHQVKILDQDTNEILCRGEWFRIETTPFCIFNELKFSVFENEAHIELASLQNFIHKKPIIEEIKNEEPT